jgi:hypothetical protein
MIGLQHNSGVSWPQAKISPFCLSDTGALAQYLENIQEKKIPDSRQSEKREKGDAPCFVCDKTGWCTRTTVVL